MLGICSFVFHTAIEAVETRMYNIKQEKISGDNVYRLFYYFYNDGVMLWINTCGKTDLQM